MLDFSYRPPDSIKVSSSKNLNPCLKLISKRVVSFGSGVNLEKTEIVKNHWILVRNSLYSGILRQKLIFCICVADTLYTFGDQNYGQDKKY